MLCHALLERKIVEFAQLLLEVATLGYFYEEGRWLKLSISLLHVIKFGENRDLRAQDVRI